MTAKAGNTPYTDDVTSSGGRPSTAATTNASNAQAQDQAPNLKAMKEDERKRHINGEFMDYMGTFVTKGNVKTLPGTINHMKAEKERRELLNQIKHGEDVEDFEPDVADIAEYVQEQLQIGWKTVVDPNAA